MVEQFILHFRTRYGNSAKFARFYDMGFNLKTLGNISDFENILYIELVARGPANT